MYYNFYAYRFEGATFIFYVQGLFLLLIYGGRVCYFERRLLLVTHLDSFHHSRRLQKTETATRFWSLQTQLTDSV